MFTFKCNICSNKVESISSNNRNCPNCNRPMDLLILDGNKQEEKAETPKKARKKKNG